MPLVNEIRYFSYRFDVSHTDENYEKLKQWLSEFPYYTVSIEHGKVTGKEHYQGAIGCLRSDDYLRSHRPFPTLVKTSYSIGMVRELDTYLSYLMKENMDLVKGWTLDYLNGLPKWVEQKKKTTKSDYLNVLITRWRENHDDSEEYYTSEYVKFVMDSYHQDKKVIDSRRIRQLIVTLMSQTSEKNKNHIEKIILSDISTEWCTKQLDEEKRKRKQGEYFDELDEVIRPVKK